MKKKILFVIPSLGVGGAEKSLVTLLSLFDYDKYDVSLLAFRHGGLLSTFLPKQVNIIGGTEDYEMFDGDAKSAVKYFLKNRKFSAAVDRIKYIINYRNKDHYIREKKQWGFLEKQLPKLEEKFDCAIGYLEGNSCYYVADDVNADKKIFFFHSDFNKLGIGTKISNEYFEKADKIVTVSEQCLQSIIDAFPDKSDKFCVIENITSREVINNQAQSKPVFNNVGDKTVLLSVGRIAPPKAIDLAVEACAELKKRKRNIVWYQIGAGPLEDEIRKLIDNSGVKTSLLCSEKKRIHILI
jgi:glycosyltransferase involved in cell wall biosynthesis